MLLLLSLQALLFASALLLLAAPFIYFRQSLLAKSYVVPAVLLLLMSSLLYVLLSDRQRLAAWFSGGKQHYQLLETFNNLGGVNGAILSLQKHLVDNPKDAQAWELLGKLYLGQQDVEHAQLAFERVRSLKPVNP